MRGSAAERSPIKRASASGRHLQQPPSATDSAVTSTATPLELDGSMADRYYAMAENMNTRGAMEMAVPFYRQAITLLLAERASLQQKLGGASAHPVAQELPLDELHGLLEAAEALGQSASTPAPTATDVRAQAAPASAARQPITRESAEAQIAELASELGKENALQVIAGLKALADGSGGHLPARGLALLGQAQMLLGQPADGLQSFEAALAASPSDAELQINTGAARLANGDAKGALALLRGVWHEGVDNLRPKSLNALYRNLSAAESKASNLNNALFMRLRWLQHDPQAVPLQAWLSWAKQGLSKTNFSSETRKLSMEIINELLKHYPDDTVILKVLADALEGVGDYRIAALIYRKLLKPE